MGQGEGWGGGEQDLDAARGCKLITRYVRSLQIHAAVCSCTRSASARAMLLPLGTTPDSPVLCMCRGGERENYAEKGGIPSCIRQGSLREWAHITIEAGLRSPHAQHGGC